MVKIYSLADPRTGEIKYIGKTEVSLQKRLKGHDDDISEMLRGVTEKLNFEKIHWLLDLKKLGLEAIIEEIDEVPFEMWSQTEIYWVSQFRTWGYDLYNIADGGNGFSSDQVKKLWQNPEYRKFHTERVQGEKHPMYGKKHTPETLKKMSDKKSKPRPQLRGENNPLYGRKLSDERKTQISSVNGKSKPVLRYDSNGNFLDEWQSNRLMCIILKERDSVVLSQTGVLWVMQGKQYIHRNYFFRYKEGNAIPLKIDIGQAPERKLEPHPNRKSILRFDLDGNFIDEWYGISKMVETLGFGISGVRKVLSGKNKQHKGFTFKIKK